MRTTKAQQAKNHRLIIRVAVDLMTEHGFEGATMKQIARAASIGDATIYSKDGGSRRITGCETFVSTAGVERALFAHADTWFTTVHANPTDEHDLDKLREMFVDESYDLLPLGVAQ